mmetsp:Transcript_10766/g.19640  ORF Transcript_10766/g.19640 Transcript_10766/m.19640 type:complete len:514 (-) Transcript_10766:109-1650(-)|eukprot:CAMPEP_0198285236 /NCGR_PEP_ID=MMETSP1449-20131203/4558_1 /TAXON_ID=420275 /ORGANISM="Attheya septentrionalis, Strain CCMP2084" /LENGTH=513 /DNA_ID=CAMNT_0043982577 /DNA_START=146 /DNA_END=1687 /DNA_ORIENTATION=-
MIMWQNWGTVLTGVGVAILVVSNGVHGFVSRSIIRNPSTFPSHSLSTGDGSRTPFTRVDAGAQGSRSAKRRIQMSDSNEGQVEGDSPKSGMLISSFNLMKGMAGASVLALPSGVAAVGDVPLALVPATALMVSLGTLSAYSFLTIGRICCMSGNEDVRSLNDAWTNEVGANSAWIISLCCFLVTFGATLAYSILLGDTFSSLAATAGAKGIWASRHASILAITPTILFQLCHLESLAALAPFSIAGTLCLFATSIFMSIRAFVGGRYALPNGAFLASLASEFRPTFGKIGLSKIASPSALILGSMTATSYLVHFSAPEFYSTLKDNSLPRFGALTAIGFIAVGLLNSLFMISGFLTFGGACAGNVLNNYSTLDAGASICRGLMTFGILGSYPFMFLAMKSAFFQLTQKGKTVSKKLKNKVTNSLLAVIIGLALLLEDAGFAVSMNGALMGAAIIYIFPSIMFLKATTRRLKEGGMVRTTRLNLERAFNKFLIGFGAICGVSGSIVCILETFFP